MEWACLELEDVAGEFNGGNLHAQAKAQVGNLVLAGVSGGLDFALDAPLAKAARHQDAAQPFQHLLRPEFLNRLRLDFLDLHPAIVGHSAVGDGFIDRFVGVVQLDVFADNADADAMARRQELADDFLPMRHVGRRRVQMEQPADQVIDPLALEHQRQFVNGVLDVGFLDHRLVRDVAEDGDFLAQIRVPTGVSQRQTRMWGVMPISRSLATDCWVGLVFNSPAALMNGT